LLQNIDLKGFVVLHLGGAVLKLLFWLFSVFCFFLLVKSDALAADFTSQGTATYTVQDNGNTLIEQQLTFKNLTAGIVIPEYVLTLDLTAVENVKAETSSKAIPVTVERQDSKILLKPDLGDYPLKSNQTFSWKLTYETAEIAQKNGQIWEVTLPYHSSEQKDSLVILKVPKSLGEENYISPQPSQKSQDPATYEYRYENSAELSNKSANASFGGVQLYRFKLKYHLQNETEEEVYSEIALPADKINQMVYLESLDPKPISVTVDGDQNYLARYKLAPSQKLEIILSGQLKVFPQKYDFENSGFKNDLPGKLEVYLKPQKFWEVYDNHILEKAGQLTDESKTVAENARSIFNFVTGFLKYATEPETRSQDRFGAANALLNPNEAVCMEFSDLTIALLRAAGIPAREIDGVAYAPTEDFNIGFFGSLHTWVEFYVPFLGWVQVDPTWSAPPSTIELFSQFDTKHLTFVTKGLGSESPYPAGSYKADDLESADVEVELGEETSLSKTKLETNLSFQNGLVTLFWNEGQLALFNPGPQVLYNLKITFEGENLQSQGENRQVNIFPPFSSLEIPLKLKARGIWKESGGNLSVTLQYSDHSAQSGEQKEVQTCNFVPFWKNFILPLVIFGGGFLLFWLILQMIEYVEKSKKS